MDDGRLRRAGLDYANGSETFDVVGQPAPRAGLTVVMHRADGEAVKIPVICRLDTAEEAQVYAAGSVLQRFLRRIFWRRTKFKRRN